MASAGAAFPPHDSRQSVNLDVKLIFARRGVVGKYGKRASASGEKRSTFCLMLVLAVLCNTKSDRRSSYFIG